MTRRTGLWTIAAAASPMLCTAPAHAHGADSLWSGTLWTFDPWMVAPLYISGVAYLVGTTGLWRHAGFGRGIGLQQSACFWCGWTGLALALLSPLHWVGERLFAAHMVEHCILIAVGAPLIVIARPTAATLWALPKPAAAALVALAHWPPFVGAWRKLTSPVTANIVHGAMLWAWHMPALYVLTLVSVGWHRFEHILFTLSAMLFWWSLARGGNLGLKLACLFVTTLHTSLLGLLLTLSPRLWYPAQSALAADWGLTPLQDQQLAGLVMWVPMGAVYTVAALWVASRWIAGASQAPCSGVRPVQALAFAKQSGGVDALNQSRLR